MDNQHFVGSFASSQYVMSLWEVAHRWVNRPPSDSDPLALSFEIKDVLIAMMLGQERSELGVVRSRRGSVLKDWRYISDWRGYHPQDSQDWDGTEDHLRELWHEYMSKLVERHDAVIFRHEAMIEGSESFDQEYLESIFIDQYDLGKWAVEYNFPFPDFWFSDDEKKDLMRQVQHKHVIEKKFSDDLGADADADSSNEVLSEFEQSEDKDLAEVMFSARRINQKDVDLFWDKLEHKQQTRILCRCVAENMWKKHPNMTIAELKSHEVIQLYCGANYYLGRETVRNWIKSVDPRPPEKKPGRPPIE